MIGHCADVLAISGATGPRIHHPPHSRLRRLSSVCISGSWGSLTYLVFASTFTWGQRPPSCRTSGSCIIGCDSFSMDDAHVSHDIWAASRSFHGNDKVVCAVMCIVRSLQRTCTFTALRIMQPSHGVCLFMMLLVRRAQKPTDGDDLSRQ